MKIMFLVKKLNYKQRTIVNTELQLMYISTKDNILTQNITVQKRNFNTF